MNEGLLRVFQILDEVPVQDDRPVPGHRCHRIVVVGNPPKTDPPRRPFSGQPIRQLDTADLAQKAIGCFKSACVSQWHGRLSGRPWWCGEDKPETENHQDTGNSEN
jgi:hypothetical protein